MIKILLFSFLSFSAFSQNDLTYFNEECILDDGDVSCSDFIEVFNSYYFPASKEDSDFQFTLNIDLDNDDPTSIIYIMTLKKGETLLKTITREYGRTLPGSDITLDLASLLNAVVGDEFNVDAEEVNSGFLIMPSLRANFNSFANSRRLGIGGGGSARYIDPMNRFEVSFYGNYSNNKQPTTATVDGFEITNKYRGTRLAAIRSLKNKNFSVMAEYYGNTVGFQHSPTIDLPEAAQDNVSKLRRLRVGGEWVQRPFIGKSSGNIAAQVEYQLQNHQYLDPLTYEYMKETYHVGKVEVRVERYFNQNNAISASLSAFRDFRWGDYKGINLGINPEFTVAKRLQIAPSFNLGYIDNRILSASANRGTNFLSLTGANRDAEFTYFSNLTLRYTIGSRSLNDKDRRWR